MKQESLINYDYNLPENLIALEPLNPRSASKLLVYSNKTITDSRFKYLFKYLKPNDCLIFNDTKVLNAKLNGRRIRSKTLEDTNASVELLLLEKLSESRWVAFCKPLRKVKISDELVFSSNLSAKIISKTSDRVTVEFSENGAILDKEILACGQLPLPPYITKNRSYKDSDEINYQSIFARQPGAIASPTASLHFDQTLLNRLKHNGIDNCFVTLHVGAGTFLPVKTENIAQHKMHFERGLIDKKSVNKINSIKANGGRIIAVGTTVLRLIESAAIATNKLETFDGKTDIFIRPGFKFKIIDGLITNFHFPKSTLLMLVSAFVGDEERKRIYSHALANEYRFFSYGDSSLLIPKS